MQSGVLLHRRSLTLLLRIPSKMSALGALHFSSLQGKLDTGLLQGLKSMNFEFMTPVQQQVLSSLPTMDSDWYAEYSKSLAASD